MFTPSIICIHGEKYYSTTFITAVASYGQRKPGLPTAFQIIVCTKKRCFDKEEPTLGHCA
jgi:hypothetical protein